MNTEKIKNLIEITEDKALKIIGEENSRLVVYHYIPLVKTPKLENEKDSIRLQHVFLFKKELVFADFHNETLTIIRYPILDLKLNPIEIKYRVDIDFDSIKLRILDLESVKLIDKNKIVSKLDNDYRPGVNSEFNSEKNQENYQEIIKTIYGWRLE